MVLPDYRNGPIGFGLLKTAAAELSCSGGLAVAPAACRLFTALGYRDLGAIPNYIKPLRPGRILRAIDLGESGWLAGSRIRPALQLLRSTRMTGIAGGFLRAGMAVRTAGIPLRTRSISSEVTSPARVVPELNELWPAARSGMGCAVVRDGEALVYRYGQEGSEYHWIAARRKGELAGLAILKGPSESTDHRIPGLRLAAVSDVLFRPEDSKMGLALLGSAERFARERGADAVIASTTSEPLGSLMTRGGYLAIPGTVHFLFRCTNDNAHFGPGLTDWWLTRGDGGADEGF